MGNHRALSLSPLQSGASFDSVCCSSTSNSVFPGLGFESQSRFFWFFSFSTFCNGQSMENVFSKNFIDWLIWVVIGVTSQKTALTGIRTLDLETWNLKWKWNCVLNCSTRSISQSDHTVEETGKAPYECLLFHTVFQWVFIRQLALSASKYSCPEAVSHKSNLPTNCIALPYHYRLLFIFQLIFHQRGKVQSSYRGFSYCAVISNRKIIIIIITKKATRALIRSECRLSAHLAREVSAILDPVRPWCLQRQWQGPNLLYIFFRL